MASPAGLTARARPEARPETRAANLPKMTRHPLEGGGIGHQRGKQANLDTDQIAGRHWHPSADGVRYVCEVKVKKGPPDT